MEPSLQNFADFYSVVAGAGLLFGTSGNFFTALFSSSLIEDLNDYLIKRLLDRTKANDEIGENLKEFVDYAQKDPSTNEDIIKDVHIGVADITNVSSKAIMLRIIEAISGRPSLRRRYHEISSQVLKVNQRLTKFISHFKPLFLYVGLSALTILSISSYCSEPFQFKVNCDTCSRDFTSPVEEINNFSPKDCIQSCQLHIVEPHWAYRTVEVLDMVLALVILYYVFMFLFLRKVNKFMTPKAIILIFIVTLVLCVINVKVVHLDTIASAYFLPITQILHLTPFGLALIFLVYLAIHHYIYTGKMIKEFLERIAENHEDYPSRN